MSGDVPNYRAALDAGSALCYILNITGAARVTVSVGLHFAGEPQFGPKQLNRFGRKCECNERAISSDGVRANRYTLLSTQTLTGMKTASRKSNQNKSRKRL